MRKMSMLFLTSGILFSSCTQPNILGDCPDPIESIVQNQTIEKDGGSTEIDIRNNYDWWLQYLQVDGVREVIDSVIEISNSAYYFTTDNLKFEKVSQEKIIITLLPNPSASDRKVYVTLQSGNCFGGFMLNQKGE